MTLQAAPHLSGRTITVQDAQGLPVVIAVDEDGFLSRQGLVAVPRDGDGNLLEVREVEVGPGEPVAQYFVFPELDEVPPELTALAVDLDGEQAVLARYVRGVHMVKEQVEIDEELEELILAHQATAGSVRRVELDSEDAVVEEDDSGEEE